MKLLHTVKFVPKKIIHTNKQESQKVCSLKDQNSGFLKSNNNEKANISN
jgi:hypothetical protein